LSGNTESLLYSALVLCIKEGEDEHLFPRGHLFCDPSKDHDEDQTNSKESKEMYQKKRTDVQVYFYGL